MVKSATSIILFILASFAIGCASSGRRHHAGDSAADFTIVMPQSELTVPNDYAWKKQKFGEGSLQEAQLPKGGSLKLKRVEATNLSAIVSEADIHSLQVFAMELVSPSPLPKTDELLAAFASQPFTQQGMTRLQEDRGSINYGGARCSRVSGKVEVKGSEKFQNVPFDFQVTQLDCVHPKADNRIIRLSISERARKGTPFVSDDLERDIASTLQFK